MKKAIFTISKMDCPSEEQLIRMKLEGFQNIRQLTFEIAERRLTVVHEHNTHEILNALHGLQLDSSLDIEEETESSDFNSNNDSSERKILLWVLLINFTFFLIELIYGWWSHSMGLIADSLDMLADSLVYGLSLLAVGGSIVKKKKVAKASGYFQLTLAAFGLIEVIRRFLGVEEIPLFQNMMVISFLALCANSVSLYLIQKARSKEVHMQASAIFTSNDILINMGVIIAGALVYLTQSKYPDLIIGIIIFIIVMRGAVRILNLSK